MANFGAQFRPRNLRPAATQWDDRDISHQSTAHDRLSKGFEFRNSVTRFCENGSSRTADAILRRLHDQQKRTQFCDLTINCDGKQFRAHKVVIAAVSEVVEREAWMNDEVTLKDIQADILEKIIDYCYTQMLGPFTSKKEVETLVKAITALKIRQLDVVTAQLKEGLSTDTDYIGSAISGNILISAEIVTAAMIGHTLPPVPSSSYGLADLEETGLNVPGGLIPELSDEDIDEIAAVAAAVVHNNPDTENSKSKEAENGERPLKALDEETRKRMPHKKRIVALAQRDLVRSSSSSSSSSSSVSTSSESDDNAKIALTARRPKRTFGGKKENSPRKNPAASPSRVPKKRKAVATSPRVATVKEDVSTPKRQRCRTNEGIQPDSPKTRTKPETKEKGENKTERRGRPRKLAPVYPEKCASPAGERRKVASPAAEKNVKPEKVIPAISRLAKFKSPPRSTRSGRSSPARKESPKPSKSPSPARSPRVKKTVDAIQQILDDEKEEDMAKSPSPAPVVKSPIASNGHSEVKPEPGKTKSLTIRIPRVTVPDDGLEVKQEAEEPAENEESENDKRKTRRRTMPAKLTETKKEIKKEPKTKIPRRKSVSVIIPAVNIENPYDDKVGENLRLNGDEFVKATGYCMKVAYLHHVLQQKNE